MNPADLLVPMPSQADEVWERLVAFATTWWRAPGPKEGVPSAELDQAERRLGIKLPFQVRNAYALFGRYPELTELRVVWRQPHELAFAGDVLVLFTEDFPDYPPLWGIRRGDLALADPPVVACLPERKPPAPQVWVPAADRFSEFFVESSLLEAVESSPYRNWTQDGRLFSAPAGLRGIRIGPATRRFVMALWGGDDVLVLAETDEGHTNIVIGARTREAYERARAMLPGAVWETAPDLVQQTDDFTDLRARNKEVEELLRLALGQPRKPSQKKTGPS